MALHFRKRMAGVCLVMLGFYIPIFLLSLSALLQHSFLLPATAVSSFPWSTNFSYGSTGQRQFQNTNQATRQRPGGCEERLLKFYKKGKNCEPRQVPKTKFTPMRKEVNEQEKGKRKGKGDQKQISCLDQRDTNDIESSFYTKSKIENSLTPPYCRSHVPNHYATHGQ